MSKFDSPLNNIRIASPCQADWNEMYGDNRRRFCGDCKLNVYNLSGMTRDEAESLIIKAEGRLCVRFYRRADGTIITQDCPVGWAKVKQRTKVYVTAVASVLMALFTGVLLVSLFSKQKPLLGELHVPFATPTPTPDQHVMGGIGPSPLMGKPVAIQGDASIGEPTQKNSKFEMGRMKAIKSGKGDS